MPSRESIINEALDRLAERRTRNLEEDRDTGTALQQQIIGRYDDTLALVLRKLNAASFRRTQSIAETPNLGHVTDWPHYYLIPDDAVRTLAVNGNPIGLRWRPIIINGRRYVGTEATSPARLTFAVVPDAALLPSDVAHAVALKLAMDAAPRAIDLSLSDRRDIADEYRVAMIEAQMIAGHEAGAALDDEPEEYRAPFSGVPG